MLYNGEEYLDYSDAAAYVRVSKDCIIKAITIGVLLPVRLEGEKKKYIPKWELDAVMDRPVSSRRTAEYLSAIRRKRNAAELRVVDEPEFNVDGTPEYISASELSVILREHDLRFEQLLNDKLREQSAHIIHQVENLIPTLVPLLLSAIMAVQEHGGIENPVDAEEELLAYLEQRQLDPTLPIPQSIQSKIDAIHPEAWAASMALGKQMIEQLSRE